MTSARDGLIGSKCPLGDPRERLALAALLERARKWRADEASGRPRDDADLSERPLQGMSEAASATDGARAALDELLARLHEPIRRFALGRVRRFPDATEIAADVAQEALIRLADGVERCRADSDGQVMAWALVTTRRVLIDMLRRPGSGLAAREVAVALERDLGAQSFEESVGTRPDASPGFEVLLRLAIEAYRETPDETADLVWRRLVTGAAWEEVAREFNTTAPGAKRRFQRATARLRRMVEQRIAALDDTERTLVERLLARLFPGGGTGEHTGRGAA